MPSPPPAPLQGLKDVVLPGAVPWWPLAPGWYAVALVLLALLAFAVHVVRRRRAANRYRRVALRELDALVVALGQKGGRHVLAARLPELLKRVALHVAPRRSVASLTGPAWLAELDRLYGGDGFTKGPGKLLPKLAYGTPTSLSRVQAADIDALVRLSREWIERHRARVAERP